MAQLQDVQSPQPIRNFITDLQPISRPAQLVAEVLTAAPHSHHGEIFNVQQAWLDVVSNAPSIFIVL